MKQTGQEELVPWVMRRRAARVSACVLAAASVLLSVLYAANLPFYSGSSVGSRLNWRMEHGRLRLTCVEVNYPESFYIAHNSEGLKFAPEWRVNGWNRWMVNVPLWMPLGACAAGSAWLFILTRKRRKAGACGKCGYDLKGLPGEAAAARCPECGERETANRT